MVLLFGEQGLILALILFNVGQCAFSLALVCYTPNNALYGELAWHPPHVKQWKSVAKQWHRTLKMDESRIKHKCFVYCNDKSGSYCKNWQCVFNSHMLNIGMETLVVNSSNTSAKYFSSEVVANSLQSHIIYIMER